MRTFILTVACGLIPAWNAVADEANDIAPFLDETVFAVGRVDLEQLEPAGIAPWLQGESAPEAEQEQLSELLSGVRQTLRDLGVSRVYAVYSFNDVGEQMPYLVVPAADAEHARRVAAYLYSGDPDGPTSLEGSRVRPSRLFEVSEPIGATVFCGRRAARRRLDDAAKRHDGRIVKVDNQTRTVWINLGHLDKLQARVTFSVYRKDHRGAADVTGKIEVTRVLGPRIAEARILEEDPARPIAAGDPINSRLWSAGRSGLAASLAVVRDSSVSFVVAPTADQRRVIGEMFPTLPTDLGALSGAEIAGGLDWLAATVDPVTGSATLIAQASDDAFTVRLSESIPPLIGLFLSDQSSTVTIDGNRVTFVLDSMQPASPLVSTLLGSLLQAGRRFDETESLKELAIAMHNFHDVWSSFPPPASYDREGRPLLSWRVYLLPYLDERELYGQFHFDEPWDSPHNSELIAKMPDVFKSNDLTLDLAGKTRFLLPVADETPWHGKVGTTIREITDGTSNTIMIVEADRDRAAVWTQPVDLPIDWERPQDGLTGNPAGFRAAFCDGSVERIRADIDPQVLTVLLTNAAGEVRDSEYDIHPE